MMNSALSPKYGETSIQKASLAVGLGFIVVGLMGYFPSATPSVAHIQGAGIESGAYLLGLFQVSLLHNGVHLVFGALGVAAADGVRRSRMYFIWGGIAYLALSLYGLFAIGNDDINIIPVDQAGNWLHLAFGITMILALFVGPHRRDRTITSQADVRTALEKPGTRASSRPSERRGAQHR